MSKIIENFNDKRQNYGKKGNNLKILMELFKNNNNVEKVVMLTGDRENISESVANALNLDEYHAELLPQDKVSWVEKLMMQKLPNRKLIFVGDGINDAPVLALSDIGVAMGGRFKHIPKMLGYVKNAL